MSTPELKPETPMSDAQRIRVNMREWPDDMRELCRLDFARKLESALNAAREAIADLQEALDDQMTSVRWSLTCAQSDEDSEQSNIYCADNRAKAAKEKGSAALAQIDKALSPQQSKTT